MTEELLDGFSDLVEVAVVDIDSFSKEGRVGIDAAISWSMSVLLISNFLKPILTL